MAFCATVYLHRWICNIVEDDMCCFNTNYPLSITLLLRQCIVIEKGASNLLQMLTSDHRLCVCVGGRGAQNTVNMSLALTTNISAGMAH